MAKTRKFETQTHVKLPLNDFPKGLNKEIEAALQNLPLLIKICFLTD